MGIKWISLLTLLVFSEQFSSIQVMVGGTCVNHPKGTNKGYHALAL